MNDYAQRFQEYCHSAVKRPLFLCGDASAVLRALPEQSIDFCMTSPPYWSQREYGNGGIGLEPHVQHYVTHLLEVCAEIQRVLRPSGSFWLNMGDGYRNKGLLGLPWRIALAMTDEQGWILRNDVVWNKLKGPDNSTDKLRPVHEYVFHFVKHSKYFYDVDAIRSAPRKTHVKNGVVISATGVTGVKYRRQIELSTALDEAEKAAAMKALEQVLSRLQQGEISDFRMVIRKQQRTTHSNSPKISGRARELAEKGFYFLFYHPSGSKPGDVWEIIPEDTTGRGEHYAAYPADLCKIPLLATCPPDGIALDPFCGTGTTNLVAMQLGRKSIGIDLSTEYLRYAEDRCNLLL